MNPTVAARLSGVALCAALSASLLVAAPACYDVECDLGCATSWSGFTELLDAADFPKGSAHTPVAFVDPDDGLPHRLIPTKEGKIWVWDGAESTVAATPFLDLAPRVNSSGTEVGLVALAVDPEYRETGELYVLYTALESVHGLENAIVIERYRRDPADPERALAESNELVLLLDHRGGEWHHGGSLVFGPDGLLYVSLGDGGGSCDDDVAGSPHGQNSGSLLGKILRIDVRALDAGNLAPECGGAGSAYGIPPLNPLAGETPGCGEIWALGLRNPFRMTVDRPTGDLWLGDVGQRSWEEVNFLPGDYFPLAAGEIRNFGWNCREGCSTLTCHNEISMGGPLCPGTLLPGVSSCLYGADLDPGPGALEVWDPVLCHENRASGVDDDRDWQAIIGGYRYRGAAVPALAGSYLYGDTYCGQLWRTTSFDASDPAAATADCLADGQDLLVSFGEDHLGELYLVFADGRIACLHDGSGCFWADDAGLFEDGFEAGDSRRWALEEDEITD